MTKDSRLRTVQREYGKVFVVVFGVKYQPPPVSQLKVGDDVMVVEGSTMEDVTFIRPKDGVVDHHWRSYGYIGGAKAKDKAIADWAKFTAGEKSIGMKKEGAVKRTPKLTVGHLLAHKELHEVTVEVEEHGPFLEIFELSKDFEAVSADVGVAVRFRDRDMAGSFKMAVHRRGWKTDEPLTDENSGEVVVVIRSK